MSGIFLSALHIICDLSLPVILWIDSNISPPSGFVEKSIKGPGGQASKQEHASLAIIFYAPNFSILLQAFT